MWKAKTPTIQRDMWESSGINKHENVERKTRQNIGRENCGFGFPVAETRGRTAAVRTHTSSKNCIFIGSDGAKKHRLAGEDISPPTHLNHAHIHTHVLWLCPSHLHCHKHTPQQTASRVDERRLGCDHTPMTRRRRWRRLIFKINRTSSRRFSPRMCEDASAEWARKSEKWQQGGRKQLSRTWT